MRLLDADALLAALPKDDVLLSLDVRKAIVDASTVDAVTVVRCKDCRCFSKNPTIGEGVFFPADGRCILHGYFVMLGDFCSDGERSGEA